MAIDPIEKTILIEESEMVTTKPRNLAVEDAVFFDNSKKQYTPSVFLLRYKRVFVSYAGTVFWRFTTSALSTVDYYKSKLGLKYIIYNYIRRKKITLDSKQNYILFYNNFCDCYYHWMTEAIPRLFLVKHLLPEHKIILPSVYTKFHIKSLEAFGIKKEDIVYIPVNSYVKTDNLLMPTFTGKEGIYNGALFNELRQFYTSHYRSEIAKELSFDKVYIKRKKSSIRKVANEEDVLKVVSQYGFKDIFFEDYSFEEQIQIASKAKIMISIHGAGLTNMLFMKPGSKVLEFRKKNETNFLHYYNLASTLNLNYYYLFGLPEDEKKSSKDADLLMDIESLRRIIIKMNEP